MIIICVHLLSVPGNFPLCMVANPPTIAPPFRLYRNTPSPLLRSRQREELRFDVYNSFSEIPTNGSYAFPFLIFKNEKIVFRYIKKLFYLFFAQSAPDRVFSGYDLNFPQVLHSLDERNQKRDLFFLIHSSHPTICRIMSIGQSGQTASMIDPFVSSSHRTGYLQNLSHIRVHCSSISFLSFSSRYFKTAMLYPFLYFLPLQLPLCYRFSYRQECVNHAGVTALPLCFSTFYASIKKFRNFDFLSNLLYIYMVHLVKR